MMQVLYLVAMLLLVYASGWFLVSVYVKRNDVADIAWGLGYVLICAFLFFIGYQNKLVVLLYLLVTIWAMRLSLHIYKRHQQSSEDFRYRAWRESWGKLFYLRSYLQVYLLQAFFLLIISSPILVASGFKQQTLSWVTFVGILLWMIGFYFQAVSDYQLVQFIKTRVSKELIMQTGLWKYSRHPNYFGEILMWWGLFGMVLPYPHGWISVISPITITLLLAYVSGVPLLEKRYRGNEAYEKYKKTTSPIIPMFPKK